MSQVILKNVKIRSIVQDSFKNNNGEVIHYKQLQVETIDDVGRISMLKVSLPKTFHQHVDKFNAILDKEMSFEVSITMQNNSLRLSLEKAPAEINNIKAA